MRKLLLVLAVVGAVLAGCGGGLKDKIVGTWKYSPKSLKVSGASQSDLDKAESFFGTASFEFKKDGTYSVSGFGGSADTGKWSLEGKNLTMTPDKPDKAEKPTLTVSDDGSKIHVQGPAGGQTMELDLVKS